MEASSYLNEEEISIFRENIKEIIMLQGLFIMEKGAMLNHTIGEQNALARRKLDLQIKALEVQDMEATSFALNAATNKRKLDFMEEKLCIDNLKELLAMESDEDERKVIKLEIKGLLRKKNSLAIQTSSL